MRNFTHLTGGARPLQADFLMFLPIALTTLMCECEYVWLLFFFPSLPVGPKGILGHNA